MHDISRVLTVLVILVTLTGCSGAVFMPLPGWPLVVHESGPPPHAPAHGHRRKHHRHHDQELRFDSNLGVYVVVGLTEVYFSNDSFIRLRGDGWQVSASLDGPWDARAEDRIPPGLRSKHHAKKHEKHHKHKGKAKGHGAAKGDW